MLIEYLHVFVPALGLLLNVAAQICGVRYLAGRRKDSPQRREDAKKRKNLGVFALSRLFFSSVPALTLLKSVIVGFAAGFAGVAGLEWAIAVAAATPLKTFLPLLLVNLLTYAELGYGYFHFINLGETARRIRILRELSDAPEGLTLAEILTRYNAQQIVALRLGRLIQNGQVVERDGKYYIGRPVMLLIAQSMTFLKWGILGKKSEFD
jgi:hypothetical protein